MEPVPRDLDTWLRRAVLLAVLVLGVFLRLRGLGEQALFGDEYHTIEACQAPMGTILSTFDSYGSHTVLPLLQHLALNLVGDGVWSLRLPGLLPGLLLLLLVYPLMRPLFGSGVALLGTAWLAIHPMHVYYTRFARSYALILLLAILWLCLLVRLIERVREGRGSGGLGSWSAVVLLGFLLPYTHLSTAGFVAATALASLWALRRERAALRSALFAFGTAAGLCLIAFLPILGQVREYFVEAIPEESKQRPSTWFGIPLLLAGGGVAAWVSLIGLPLGCAQLLRRRPVLGLLVTAAVAGPSITLLVSLPHGMEFAYARYLLVLVPLLPLVLGSGLRALLARGLPNERSAERLTLGLGLAAIAVSAAGGPFVAYPERPGPFDNTYLAIRPLPAFDPAWPDAPGIYAELAEASEPLTVVELPPMLSRSVLLLRNHQRRHGHRTLVGWPGEVPRGLRGEGPYIGLEELNGGRADVVLLHRGMRPEVTAYWSFVMDEVWPGMGGARGDHPDRGFMRRHADSFVRGQPSTHPDFIANLERYLRASLGPPAQETERMLVWRPGSSD